MRKPKSTWESGYELTWLILPTSAKEFGQEPPELLAISERRAAEEGLVEDSAGSDHRREIGAASGRERMNGGRSCHSSCVDGMCGVSSAASCRTAISRVLDSVALARAKNVPRSFQWLS